MSKNIVVTGAPNAGKTITAIQLANQFVQDGCRVLLVFCDANCPPKEYLFRSNPDDSLGKLLSAVELSEKEVLKAITLVSENFGFTGYNKDETVHDYPVATEQGFARFLDEVEKLADYIIFDVQRKEDTICRQLQMRGAQVITVVTSSLKSIAWAKRNSGFWADIAVLNDYRKGQVLEMEFSNPLIILPHCESLARGFETMSAVAMVNQKGYRKALAKLKEKVE